ncbi:hypothetical protein FM114_04645 [Luteococcus japonicus LSP_Lj1]|uniref:Uncharacterized protein n=1 Tax=Luteococcus japonicus LSP_Lj1 TaxID=1255658 RepID=A0A1R4IZR8_9ACTN|nr:hypothetical protein FM114_04645 [Luteococcus japonicus LSP_Lj1]
MRSGSPLQQAVDVGWVQAQHPWAEAVRRKSPVRDHPTHRLGTHPQPARSRLHGLDLNLSPWMLHARPSRHALSRDRHLLGRAIATAGQLGQSPCQELFALPTGVLVTHRHLGRRVPHARHQLGGRGAILRGHGGSSVTQVMEREIVPVHHIACLVEGIPQRLLTHRQLTATRKEVRRARPPLPQTSTPLTKRRQQMRRNTDIPDRRRRLGRTHDHLTLDPRHALTNVDPPGHGVDVPNPKRPHLPRTKPTPRGQQHGKRLPRWQPIGHTVELGHRRRLHRPGGLAPTHRTDAAGINDNQLLVHTHRQQGLEQRVRVASLHGPFRPHPVEPRANLLRRDRRHRLIPELGKDQPIQKTLVQCPRPRCQVTSGHLVAGQVSEHDLDRSLLLNQLGLGSHRRLPLTPADRPFNVDEPSFGVDLGHEGAVSTPQDTVGPLVPGSVSPRRQTINLAETTASRPLHRSSALVCVPPLSACVPPLLGGVPPGQRLTGLGHDDLHFVGLTWGSDVPTSPSEAPWCSSDRDMKQGVPPSHLGETPCERSS